MGKEEVVVSTGMPLKTKKALGRVRYEIRHPLTNNPVLHRLKEKMATEDHPKTINIKID